MERDKGKFTKGHGGGRPKGTPNRYTSLKDSFMEAFDGIGGTAGLTRWAAENRGQFYAMLTRLLPNKQEVTGPDGGPVQGSITIRFVEATRNPIKKEE